ncbi:MAG: hypothetical protein KDA60_02805 [Planctomycetales bacterium]|nr:hypothetical protein [Planctomycetales bacterium]
MSESGPTRKVITSTWRLRVNEKLPTRLEGSLRQASLGLVPRNDLILVASALTEFLGECFCTPMFC